MLGELNSARKSARTALDLASAASPSVVPDHARDVDGGEPQAAKRATARQALIVARLSIELVRAAHAIHWQKPQTTTTVQPTPLRMQDASTEQVEAAIAEMIRVSGTAGARRAPDGKALLLPGLQDNRKAHRRAFDEAVAAGIEADVAAADSMLMTARLAVQIHKKATRMAEAKGVNSVTKDAPADTAVAGGDSNNSDIWSVTLENAPADLLQIAKAKAASVQQRLTELHTAIEGAEHDDYRQAYRTELREYRMRTMAALHTERRAHRDKYDAFASPEDKARARDQLIATRLTIAMLRNGQPGYHHCHRHHHHGHHRRGLGGNGDGPHQHTCGLGPHRGGGGHGLRSTLMLACQLMANGHLQVRTGCGGGRTGMHHRHVHGGGGRRVHGPHGLPGHSHQGPQKHGARHRPLWHGAHRHGCHRHGPHNGHK